MFIFVSTCFGQAELSISNPKNKQLKEAVDTSYVKDISDKLIIKINRDSRVDSYTITEKDNSSTTILPNDRKNYFISLDYKFIGFSLGLPKTWSDSNYQNYLKGKTTDFNLNFTFFINNWVQAVYYNTVKGYYIDNPNLSTQNVSGELSPYLQLPDFKTRKIGGATSYVMNGKRFSYRSFLQQTQIQKKSSGSFIPSISYEFFYSSNRLDGFSEDEYKKILSIMTSIGYQYNLVVMKKLNFSGGVFSGYGMGYVRDFSPETRIENKYWQNRFSVNFNLNFNYSWKNVFCGVQISSLSNFTKEEDLNINNTINYENIYLGYRFDAPKIIKKPVNWLEKKLF